MSVEGTRRAGALTRDPAVTLPPDELLDRRFHLVTGKGGVGKSTVSVTLALTLAARGRRVLLCEVDERDQLAHSFAVEPSSGQLRALKVSELPGELYGVNMQVSSALSEYGELKLKVKALSQLFTDNPLTKALISVIPGVGDLIYLGKAFHHEREETKRGEKAWDAVILDAPATGHGVTFLGLPKLIRELVPIGNLKRESDEMWALLSDPARCALHVVTRAEALPTQEALELASQLRGELGLPLGALWLNQCAPPVQLDALLTEAPPQGAPQQEWEALQARCQRRSEQARVARLTERMLYDYAERDETPVARLPLLTLTRSARPLVDALLQAVCHREVRPSQAPLTSQGHLTAPELTLTRPAQHSGARLITLIGGGGVGKTTVSAGLALALAQRGERVALITIDPARRLAQALGLDALGGSLSPVPLHENLDAMMLERAVTARHLVERYASSEEVAARLSAHPYFKAFSGSMAGAQEYMALHEVSLALDSHRYDVVVLDTPPGRHALDFLDAPARLSKAVQSPALTLFSKATSGHRGGGLGRGLVLKAFGALTSAAFISDLTSFLSLFMDILVGLARDGERLIERCQRGDFLLVSTPDELPMRVAEQGRAALRERGLSARGLLVNRAPSPTPACSDELASALSERAALQLAELNAELSRALEREVITERQVRQSHPALSALPRLRIPELIGEDATGRVEAVAAHLSPLI